MDDTEDDARYPLATNHADPDSPPTHPIEPESDDSSSSRGKRRRLDLRARGFALVPRPLPPSKRRPPSPDWPEGPTFALLRAWGARYLQNGRKSLRPDEWADVARTVPTKSEAQCRNRLDALKKKYKKERERGSSEWVYFEKMDELMLPSPAPLRIACGIDAGEYVFAGPGGLGGARDSPGGTASEGEGGDESDGLPPRRGEEGSLRMLADSIERFGAVYERVEMGRRRGMEEIGRMREEFCRELEVHRRRILDRARAEIGRMRQEDGDEERSDEDGNVDVIRG